MYTGATHTIISAGIYKKNTGSNKTKINSHLSGAGGQAIKELGIGTFNLTLGSLTVRRSFMVAQIPDDVLLGMDVLQNNGGTPADILLSKGKVKLKNIDIPCTQIGAEGVRRILSIRRH